MSGRRRTGTWTRAGLAAAALAVCGLGCAGPVPEPERCEGGEWREWDRDADGIHDDFEAYAAERLGYELQPGRCDRDPSRPIRAYDDGELEMGLQIRDPGDAFRFLDRGAADWGTGPLLQCLHGVAAELKRDYGSALVVGKISNKQGGFLEDFVSHQNGLELQIFYLRAGGGARAPVDIVDAPDDYDAETTETLMRLLLERCDPHAIFAHIDALGFEPFDDRIQHQDESRSTKFFNLVLRNPLPEAAR